MNLDKKRQLYLLLNALREEVLTEEQFAELEHLVRSDSEAARDYVLYVKLWTDLQFFRAASEASSIESTADFESCTDSDFWQAMANYEKHAPEVEIPEEEPSRELIQKVVYPQREKRKLSAFSKALFVLNAAAILFFVLFFKFTPPKNRVEVATLTDSINAQWAGVTDSMEKGTRLVTCSENLILLEGLAELSFDNNATVVIEGPAEFELLAEDQIDLQYGRIYATVPQEAIGFTVSVQTSRIIDLGTEFGVQADVFGDVQLHVVKGKTTLIAGGKSNRVNVEVTEGQAKKVSGSTQTVSDIPCNTEVFARDISSDKKYVWRGRMQISLASIVAGGNGFTQGQITSGIDPATGYVDSQVIQEYDRLAGHAYYSVPDRPFVDGVFVPNGSAGPNRVSSEGHEFDGFPGTDSYYWSDITANSTVIDTAMEAQQSKRAVNIILADKNNSKESQSMILLHPNAGITFDLNKIRGSLPQVDIFRFTATCGVPDSVPQQKESEFWVLVDGRCVYHYEHSKNTLGNKVITVSLKPEDRFLTLATTDGGDKIVYDWCVFSDPQIELRGAGQ